MTGPVIRVLDIETAPNLAHVWGFWKQNVGLNQILENDFIMSFAYKDLGGTQVYSHDAGDCYLQSNREEKRAYRKFITRLRGVLDESDVVIAHNGARFDIPWVRGMCVEYNVAPPSPFKVVDTLLLSRKAFRLPSYKLDYLTKRFKCKQKSEHGKFPGHELWKMCLAGNQEAWDEMVKYNRNDVDILEEYYLKTRGYYPPQFNHGVFTESEKEVCPVCGGDHLHKRGYYRTGVSKFQRYWCTTCGSWSRSRFNLVSKSARKALVVPAL